MLGVSRLLPLGTWVGAGMVGRHRQEIKNQFGCEMESQKARAPRYQIPMPLRYRQQGEAVWFEGKVENISRTGVLFTAPDLLEQDTDVEMTFSLPVQFAGRSAGQVICMGKIVRVVMPPASDRPSALAAQIGSYKLFPQEKAAEV